jgi:hypothetical protein
MEETGRQEPGPEGVTGYELLAGAALPIHADLRVRITRGNPEQMPDALPPGTAEQLLEQEERLLGWLEESEENRVAFLTDPVGSLEQAGLQLDREVLEALREVQAQTAAADAVPPGLEIKSLKVDLARKRHRREESESSEGD